MKAPITSWIPLENGRPKDPWDFAKKIEHAQEKCSNTHTILFNKGKYFETSIYNVDVLREVSELTNIPIEYNYMIVGHWRQMEDFVIAMNCLDYYVKITIDWI